ncbi:OLC1v1017305C1 [Oldenlandia corymbosa var. corymbosa]|uniref:OLC1v1017305C1 n=1 Tax=Oldenlandia corymbosa var. corymbosa TaxID=529605 RepID=A0AAV1E971_OLDCO|nr:OLC1v1017305C1 [Oldenlandia corymbosa var. corymbosa]
MIDSVFNSSFTALTIGRDALSMVSSQRLVENQLTLSQQPQTPQKKGPQKNIGGGRKKLNEEGDDEEEDEEEGEEERDEETTTPRKESSQTKKARRMGSRKCSKTKIFSPP